MTIGHVDILCIVSITCWVHVWRSRSTEAITWQRVPQNDTRTQQYGEWEEVCAKKRMLFRYNTWVWCIQSAFAPKNFGHVQSCKHASLPGHADGHVTSTLDFSWLMTLQTHDYQPTNSHVMTHNNTSALLNLPGLQSLLNELVVFVFSMPDNDNGCWSQREAIVSQKIADENEPKNYTFMFFLFLSLVIPHDHQAV